MTCNIHEAKTNLSKLIQQALAGDEVIIAKAGKPQVKLVPVVEHPVRKPGRFKGQFEVGPEFFEPLPEEELAAWEGSESNELSS